MKDEGIYRDIYYPFVGVYNDGSFTHGAEWIRRNAGDHIVKWRNGRGIDGHVLWAGAEPKYGYRSVLAVARERRKALQHEARRLTANGLKR